MKVLIATPFYYPQIGGAEIATEQLAIQLNARGVATDVMTFVAGSYFKPILEKKIKGVKVLEVPALDLSSLKLPEVLFQAHFLPRRFLSLVNDYDILHFQNDVDLTFPIFLSKASKPKVFHTRCIATMFRIYQRNPLLQRLFKNSADVFIVIAPELVKYLRSLKIPEERIKVVPNGIDTKIFKPYGEKKDNLLLFVGRLDPVKGLHVLLESLRYVKTPVHLVIIGGPSWHQAYSKYILDLIEDSKKKSIHKITYLGYIKRDEILTWYQKAAIHIRPDVNGISGGNTTLEAMACGTPVIGTGNSVVKNHVNGIIVPPKDTIKLAKAIEFLLNDGKTRRRLGESARKFVLENYSFDIVIKKIVKIYEEIINIAT